MNYRQGDVVLVQQDKQVTLKKRAKNTIALGEATGHHHKIIDGSVWVGEDGKLYVKSGKHGKTVLRHQDRSGSVADHEPIALDPGIYEVRIEQEYEPSGWREVID